MKVLLRVDRVAAILAGYDRYGDLVVEVDPATLDLDERAALAQAPEQGGITDLTAPFPPPGDYPPPPEVAQPDVSAWLRWRMKCAKIHERALQAREADWAARAEAYIDYWRHQPVARFVCQNWPASHYRVVLPDVPGEGPPLPEPRVAQVVQRIEAALADKLAQAQMLANLRNQAQARRAARRAAERRAAQARRAEQLARWVAERMDDNAQARFQLGLLPEEEILEAMRAEAYRPLDRFTRYVKLRSADLAHHAQCDGLAELECLTDEARHLTAAQFEVYRRIEAAAPPGARLKALVHTCACTRCHAGAIRRSVQVTLPVGEWLFSREYALDG